jgi:hypothetical protein
MRRVAVKDSPTVNGIDYMELFMFKKENSTSYRPLLFVYCFKSTGLDDLNKDNVIIQGGVRRKGIVVEWILRADIVKKDLTDAVINRVTTDLSTEEKDTIMTLGSESNHVLIIRPSDSGDFSTYTLCLVRGGGAEGVGTSENGKQLPPQNFDVILSKIDFSFKVGCPSDFDCLSEDICLPYSKRESPVIDYMAKDFASFRRLILDRLSAIMPHWRERNPADMGMMLVELLSYVGDHLSYYQDAVATEAYLGTQRSKISVRRNVRLLDYFMHEGCNARCWVCFEVEQGIKGFELSNGTKLLTTGTNIGANSNNSGNSVDIIIHSENFEEALNDPGIEVFETMHDISLYHTHNNLYFYTWGDSQCCLPRGATAATIRNDGDNRLDLLLFTWNNIIKLPFNKNEIEKEFALLKNFMNKEFGLEWLEATANLQFMTVFDNVLEISDDAKNVLYLSINDNNTIVSATKDKEGKFKICDFQIKDENGNLNSYILTLKAGDVLILEEIVSPTTHKQADKNTSHRHAVRLSKVTPNFDELFGVPVLDIFWDPQDAIPFPLCIEVENQTNISSNDNPINDENNRITVSIAHGNTVLVDNGYKIVKEFNPLFIKNQLLSSSDTNYDVGSDYENGFIPDIQDTSSIVSATEFIGYAPPSIPHFSSAAGDVRFRPRLSGKPLTFKGPFDHSLPANKALNYDVHDARPDITITGGGKLWTPVFDLLESGEFDHNFVVEIDNEGTAFIRFVELGKLREIDGGSGMDSYTKSITTTTTTEPTPSTTLSSVDNKLVPYYATYRIGNGTRGNVGAESITRIVLDGVETTNPPIKRIRNPIAASGGTDPEDIELVRQYAPQAFRRQERAVTANDYMEVLRRHPEVQKAFATIRWTGSWYTVFISVDRFGGRIVDEKFKEEIRNFLNRYRLAGYDLEIKEPVYVPLLIRLNICIESEYLPGDVRQRLLQVFSNHETDVINGERGLFHPDNWSFGQPVLLSHIYEAAMRVDGVSSCTVEQFQRWGKMDNGEIEKGVIEMAYYEIARLDNDPNFPENGKIQFLIGGTEPPLKKIAIWKL